jgi:hypothetical protein
MAHHAFIGQTQRMISFVDVIGVKRTPSRALRENPNQGRNYERTAKTSSFNTWASE